MINSGDNKTSNPSPAELDRMFFGDEQFGKPESVASSEGERTLLGDVTLRQELDEAFEIAASIRKVQDNPYDIAYDVQEPEPDERIIPWKEYKQEQEQIGELDRMLEAGEPASDRVRISRFSLDSAQQSDNLTMVQRAAEQLNLLAVNFPGLTMRRDMIMTSFFINSSEGMDVPGSFNDGANTIALVFSRARQYQESLETLSLVSTQSMKDTANGSIEVASTTEKHEMIKGYLAAKYSALKELCEGVDAKASKYGYRGVSDREIRSFKTGAYSMLYLLMAESDPEFADWMNEVRDLDIIS